MKCTFIEEQRRPWSAQAWDPFNVGNIWTKKKHKTLSFRSSYTCTKYHPGFCSPFIHYVVSNDSISGQWRPWSDCMDAQAHLGLHCLHMPKDMFSLGAGPIFWDLIRIVSLGKASDMIRKCIPLLENWEQNNIALDNALSVAKKYWYFLLFPYESIPYSTLLQHHALRFFKITGKMW